jgi:hypothetical protein
MDKLVLAISAKHAEALLEEHATQITARCHPRALPAKAYLAVVGDRRRSSASAPSERRPHGPRLVGHCR